MTDITLEQRARELLAAECQKPCSYDEPHIPTRHAHAAIEAALRLSAGADWQPIETAPEGSWFLAHSEKGWIGVVRRADPDYAPGEGWFEDEHTEYVHPGWLTHWMPRPAAPRHEPGEVQP